MKNIYKKPEKIDVFDEQRKNFLVYFGEILFLLFSFFFSLKL
jgi:hypothetical protein